MKTDLILSYADYETREYVKRYLISSNLPIVPIENLKSDWVNWDIITEYIQSMPYDDFLKTVYWRSIADHKKDEAKHRCQLCNSEKELKTHHRTYENHGKELFYLDDLIILCDKCHGLFHDEKKEKREIETIKEHASDYRPNREVFFVLIILSNPEKYEYIRSNITYDYFTNIEIKSILNEIEKNYINHARLDNCIDTISDYKIKQYIKGKLNSEEYKYNVDAMIEDYIITIKIDKLERDRLELREKNKNLDPKDHEQRKKIEDYMCQVMYINEELLKLRKKIGRE